MIPVPPECHCATQTFSSSVNSRMTRVVQILSNFSNHAVATSRHTYPVSPSDADESTNTQTGPVGIHSLDANTVSSLVTTCTLRTTYF